MSLLVFRLTLYFIIEYWDHQRGGRIMVEPFKYTVDVFFETMELFLLLEDLKFGDVGGEEVKYVVFEDIH